jgi:hypothetical protein
VGSASESSIRIGTGAKPGLLKRPDLWPGRREMPGGRRGIPASDTSLWSFRFIADQSHSGPAGGDPFEFAVIRQEARHLRPARPSRTMDGRVCAPRATRAMRNGHHSRRICRAPDRAAGPAPVRGRCRTHRSFDRSAQFLSLGRQSATAAPARPSRHPHAPALGHCDKYRAARLPATTPTHERRRPLRARQRRALGELLDRMAPVGMARARLLVQLQPQARNVRNADLAVGEGQ